jgi:glycosyltransferase involved in cell wall biosynthesis
MLGEVTRMLNKKGRKLKAFGLPGNCSLIGFFDYVSSPTDKTIRALYRQAGCFISTSQHEGFSLSPLEAMACGCPTVVTNSDGNMEYAVDEENCLIENDPVAMSEKIVDLILDQPKSKRLREAGYETSRRYKWTEPVEKLSLLLESWS